MIATLLGRNLRHQRGLLVALCGGFVGLELLLVWIAAHIEAGPGLLNLMQQTLPPAFRQLIFSQFGTISFDGMVAFGFQHPVALTGAIAFAVVVATLPAAERETGFLDLILSRPLHRRSYLLGVVLTLVVGAVVLPLCMLGGVALGRLLVTLPEGAPLVPLWRYLMAALGLFALMLAIGGGTLAIACGTRRRGPAVSWAAGITLVLFTVNFLAAIWAPLRPLRWISPFHHSNPMRAVLAPEPRLVGPTVLLVVFLVLTAVAALRFERQDL